MRVPILLAVATVLGSAQPGGPAFDADRAYAALRARDYDVAVPAFLAAIQAAPTPAAPPPPPPFPPPPGPPPPAPASARTCPIPSSRSATPLGPATGSVRPCAGGGGL